MPPLEQTLTESTRSAPGILGAGVDLVHVPSFSEQLTCPGSVFGQPGRFFAASELRRAALRGARKGDGVAVHLAAVWAMKEAALKAWLGGLDRVGRPAPLSVEEFPWADFRVGFSAGGAPRLNPSRRLTALLTDSLGTVCEGGDTAAFALSASHDGDYAVAVATLSVGG